MKNIRGKRRKIILFDKIEMMTGIKKGLYMKLASEATFKTAFLKTEMKWRRAVKLP